ncbi:MAG: hypothetical protein R6W90_09315 [Ignavibacteriaceae bacterium]
MAKRTNSKAKQDKQQNLPEATIYQVDNLLRFLNDIQSPEALVPVAKPLNKNEAVKLGKNIINYRSKNKPFFRLSDLQGVPSINNKIIKLLLDNAAYKLVDTYVPAVTLKNINIINALFKINIFLNIVWNPLPDGWDNIGGFLFCSDFKKSFLEDKQKTAEARVRAAQRSLDTARHNDNENIIKTREEALQREQEKLNEINREADALNKAFEDKDLAAAWNIIKSNMDAYITALERQVRQLEKEANTLDEYRELKDLRDKLDDYKRYRDSTQSAVDRILKD